MLQFVTFSSFSLQISYPICAAVLLSCCCYYQKTHSKNSTILGAKMLSVTTSLLHMYNDILSVSNIPCDL